MFFVSRQWVYNILTPLLFVIIYIKCGSKAEDFLSDPTFESDAFVPFRLQTFTTEESSTFNRKDVYQESENLNEIGSKSNAVSTQQKLNNDAIYKGDALDGRNQVYEQQKMQSSSSSSQYQKDESPLEYVTANDSESSRERVMNHRIMAFEKHKAHHRNYRRYGHKSYGHKKNNSKYKKFEHEHSRMKQKFNGYNRQSPYYQGQLGYYGELDGVDNSFELPSEKTRNHRYHHHHHHHHHHPHPHPHNYYHSNHNRRIDEYGSSQNSKRPHLSRVQYQYYKDYKEDDLPPYIKKYKKRNKQLLDLLEGTMPPSTQSTESSIPFKKRKKSQHHYHNHKNPKWIMEDLFEEQKANPNNPNVDDDQYVNDAQSISTLDSSLSSSSSSSSTTTHSPDDIEDEELKLIRQNELPGDDISISSEEENKSTEKNTNMIIGKKEKSQQQSIPVASAGRGQKQRHEDLQSRINKFIYHRVDTAPLMVGAGSPDGSKKQKLPFVAITDRRLETSKTRQRDYEQNHLPLP